MTVEHWFMLFGIADISLYGMAARISQAIDRNTDELTKIRKELEKR